MTVIFHFSWVLTVFARLAMNSTKKVLGNLDIAANVADISTLKSIVRYTQFHYIS